MSGFVTWERNQCVQKMFSFLLKILQKALASLGCPSAMSEEKMSRVKMSEHSDFWDLLVLLGGLTEPWCKEITKWDLLSTRCPGACL